MPGTTPNAFRGAAGLLALSAALAGGGLGGCGTAARRAALEDTTRDWFATLRAAQVLPVSPLTEDLVPGDVFLVTVPMQRQHELYEREGRVPLDLAGTRLPVPEGGFAAFYADRYWRGSFDAGPFDRPADAEDPVPAPRVVFPRLRVELTAAGDAAIGLPLQSIPLGLDLLRTSRAEVTVDLRDAFTYALPADALLGSLHAWAARPEVRDTLGEMAAEASETVYLRCVTRVFLARRVSVGIHVDTDGEGRFAAASPASAAASSPPVSASVQVRQRTASSVRLEEDLGTPLVFGYLGFDVPVRASGDLGPPVATLEALRNPERLAPASAVERSDAERLLQASLADLQREVAARPGRAGAIVEAVSRGLGDQTLSALAAAVVAADPAATPSAVDAWIRGVRRFAATDAGEQARERRIRRLLDAALADAAED